MRFSDNGYYIERYIKCRNCGVLLYEPESGVADADPPYCSHWCEEWASLRGRDDGLIRLPLPERSGQAVR